MKRTESEGSETLSDNREPAEFFRKIRRRGVEDFEEIWRETSTRLDGYMKKFGIEWSAISDKVLSRLSQFAKTPWSVDKIHVHFIDCLYGGFGWNDCIGFAPFPDLEVQKKFLAHELSELITPRYTVAEVLRKNSLNLEISQTVVDMLAYFSV